jgi:hypothetical protein
MPENIEPEVTTHHCEWCDKETDEPKVHGAIEVRYHRGAFYENAAGYDLGGELAGDKRVEVLLCPDCYWSAYPHCVECGSEANKTRDAMVLGKSKAMNSDRWCCGTCDEGD